MYRQVPAGRGYSTLYPPIDFETRSRAGFYFNGEKWVPDNERPPYGLSAIGAAVYAEHASTEVLSLAYNLLDGKGERLWVPSPMVPPPQELFDYICQGGVLEAHSSFFEYETWNEVCVRKYGWPPLPIEQLRCSASKARAFGIPAKLAEAGSVLGIAHEKHVDGARLLKKFSIPCEPDWPDPQEDPVDGPKLYAYNLNDIIAESEVSERLPDLSPSELELWLADQRINARGVKIDQDRLDTYIAIYKAECELYEPQLMTILRDSVYYDKYVQYRLSTDAKLRDSVQKLQNRKYPKRYKPADIEKLRSLAIKNLISKRVEIKGASATSRLLEWLYANGCALASLEDDSVQEAIDSGSYTGDVLTVLKLRQMLASSSVKKLFAIKRRICRDGRLKDLFAYCGADRTGRASGKGPQPQNLPSAGPQVKECLLCKKHYQTGLASCPWCGESKCKTVEWSIDVADEAYLAMLRGIRFARYAFGDLIPIIAASLRGLFCADKGKDLVCSDYSAIEAVVTAALAGEEWRLDVFRTHRKIYEMSASKITGVPFEDFLEYKKVNGEHHPLRKKVGKPAELALGFGGWVNAMRIFKADKYLSEQEMEDAARAWRKASPMVVKMWYGLEDAARAAVLNPGTCYEYRGISYGVKYKVLYCKLLSGRTLQYHDPLLIPEERYGKHSLKITYMGHNSDPAKGPVGWARLSTWGGKLAENVVQATARDILMHALVNAEKAGYAIVLHVHDELVAEIAKDFGSIEELENIMGTLPDWCKDWPIKAAGGWRGERYRK